jgi:O-antigen ligase
MFRDLFQGPMFRLNIVIMSSLAFLAFGLRTPGGLIGTLQLPVAALQVYFIVAVALQVGVQGLVAPLTNAQRSLIGALIVYVIFVSAISPVPSAHILAISWIIHILFFVALISFFSNVGVKKAEVIWSALGLTALLHVCAFLTALVIWPAAIYAMDLPAFGNIRHLGYLLAPAAAVMAMLFVTRTERALFPLICFMAAAFYILYTGSRGGAIGLLGGLTATGAFWAWHGRKAYLSRVLTLLAVTGILIIISEFLPTLPWPPVFSRGAAAFDPSGAEMLRGRGIVWSFVIQAIQQNWLWGYGPGLMYELPDYPVISAFFQPHNIGLQLLMHWGLVGTCIILATAVSFSSNVLAALREKPGKAILPLAVSSAIFAHALVDGGLFYPFSVVIAIIAFAILEGIGRQQSSVSTNAA